MQHRGVTRWIAGLLSAVMVMGGVPASPVTEAQAKNRTERLSYKGYSKVWEDNFDGDSLNMKDWNIETHEPGWVNAELQEYTESGNYTVKDGALTIIPKKTKNADGTYSYSSARINTQNKHDFKYGIMEAKMKFPKGQGYLPAFWMMPTNENFYGQWPKCGEIDIAEVMGQDTKKLYGTIHYGEPHAQSQGTEVLKKGDFSDEWHTCAVEWEPGSIKWYVDGVLYHEEHSWYSKTVGQGEVTYPAPFDQNFYLILNLAVGGSWVGYPDETTSFDSNFQVDYVRVYQKKNYKENVKKPVKKVVLKKADKNGNYVSNASFAKNEKLDGSANWQFLGAQNGVGSAAIQDKNIVISTKNAGKEDYSIQLVQPGLPMEKGAAYEVSFDAYAAEKRTMKVDISGPDMNYMRYFQDTTVNLTTKKKSYKYTFTMAEDTDANSRLEFNLGAQGSTADVHITNVKVKKIKNASKAENDKKTVLADGNLVYNGKFQEGTNRLGFWKVTKKNASVSVTNKNYNKRQLAVKIKKESKASDIKVYQTDLAFEKNKEYSVSFDASATTARTVKVKVAGKTFTAKLKPSTKQYSFIVKTGKKLSDKDVVFYLGGKKGTVTLDNVIVTENSLIKNGSFNAGTTGWTEWHESNEADVSYVIDSLSEDNAADFTIKKTGSEEWKIQLMQKNIPLVKDQYYKLTFKAKSSRNRQIRAIIQGLEDKNWEVYSGENIVDLTKKYQTYTKVFQMTADSDPAAQLSFNLGAAAGKVIDEQHRVCIDDVNLEVISEEEAKKILGEGPKTKDTMIKDGTFVKGMEQWTEWHDANEADAKYEVANNEIHFTVNKTGSEDWKIQFKQENIKLEKDHYYKLVFDGKSDLERKVRATLQGGESRGYTHYAGEYFVTLGKDYQTYEHVFKMNESTDDKTSFQICMGAVGSSINKTHNMYFKDFSLEEISEEEEKKLVKNVSAGGGGGYSPSNSGFAGENESQPVKLTSLPVGNIAEDKLVIVSDAKNKRSITAKVEGDGSVKISVSKKDGDNTPLNAENIEVPVAKADSITPGVTSKIRVSLNCTQQAELQSFRSMFRRSAQLLAENSVENVKFAVKDKNGTEHWLKDEDGNAEIVVTASAIDKELICDSIDADLLEGATVVCAVGEIVGKTLTVSNVSKVEYKNTLGSNENWQAQISEAGAVASSTMISNGFRFEITNPGTATHHIQIGKDIGSIKKGATYEYSFKAKVVEEGKSWTVKSCVQPGESKKWYDSNTEASVLRSKVFDSKGSVISKKFVAAEDDSRSGGIQLVISLGHQDGENKTPWTQDYGKVTVEITDIRFVKISEAKATTTPAETSDTVTIGEENSLVKLTADGNIFKNGAEGVVKKTDNHGEVQITITNAGNAGENVLSNVELAQESVPLEVGAKYNISYHVSTDKIWYVGRAMFNKETWKLQDESMGWGDSVENKKDVAVDFTASTTDGKFVLQMGRSEGNVLAASESVTFTISNFKVVKIADAAEDGTINPPAETNLFKNTTYTKNGDVITDWEQYGLAYNYTYTYDEGRKCVLVYVTKDNSGDTPYDAAAFQKGISLEPGTYTISYTIKSFTGEYPDQNSYERWSKCVMKSSSAQDATVLGYSDSVKSTLDGVACSMTFTVGEKLTDASFYIFLGQYNNDGTDASKDSVSVDKYAKVHRIEFHDLKLVKTK